MTFFDVMAPENGKGLFFSGAIFSVFLENCLNGYNVRYTEAPLIFTWLIACPIKFLHSTASSNNDFSSQINS